MKVFLGLRGFEEICGHPVFSSVWEQIVLSNIRGWHPNAEICFYRTSNGAEADFVASVDGNVYAIECKVSANQVLSRGNYLKN